MFKHALETDIVDLQAKADSYPTDLQNCLDSLSDAAKKYRVAAADKSGKLDGFLKKIKVNRVNSHDLSL